MHYEVFWICFIESLYFSNTIQFRFLSPCGLMASVTSWLSPWWISLFLPLHALPLSQQHPSKTFFLPCCSRLWQRTYSAFILSTLSNPNISTQPPALCSRCLPHFKRILHIFFQFQETNVVYSSLHFLASAPFSQQSTSPIACFSPSFCLSSTLISEPLLNILSRSPLTSEVLLLLYLHSDVYVALQWTPRIFVM